jgi:hypothetical protein
VELTGITYQGPPIDDEPLLALLPADLVKLLRQLNGWIQFRGGLHVRGACREPAWHSLRAAWLGEQAFSRLYPGIVAPDEIPFAEDCAGDQFLLRKGKVTRLLAESGEREPLEVDLAGFLASVEEDPLENLGLAPLLQLEAEGGRLQPGELLAAYPPFVAQESSEGVVLKAVPAAERYTFLADLAASLGEEEDDSDSEFEDES